MRARLRLDHERVVEERRVARDRRRTSPRTRRTRGARPAARRGRTRRRPRTRCCRRCRAAPRSRRAARTARRGPHGRARRPSARPPGGGWCRGTPAPASPSAASASTRTFDGPEPKRPSAGSSSGGRRMSAGSVTARGYRGTSSAAVSDSSARRLCRCARSSSRCSRYQSGAFVRAHFAETSPAEHALERVAVAEREEDVAEHRDPDAEREPVVHERRAGAPVERERRRTSA